VVVFAGGISKSTRDSGSGSHHSISLSAGSRASGSYESMTKSSRKGLFSGRLLGLGSRSGDKAGKAGIARTYNDSAPMIPKPADIFVPSKSNPVFNSTSTSSSHNHNNWVSGNNNGTGNGITITSDSSTSPTPTTFSSPAPTPEVALSGQTGNTTPSNKFWGLKRVGSKDRGVSSHQSNGVEGADSADLSVALSGKGSMTGSQMDAPCNLNVQEPHAVAGASESLAPSMCIRIQVGSSLSLAL